MPGCADEGLCVRFPGVGMVRDRGESKKDSTQKNAKGRR
jgi:hypothetical protein